MSPSSTSNSEGLIGTPPELALGEEKKLAWLVTGFFLFTCIATALVDQLFPAPIPELIGAERIEFQSAERQAKISDGTKARVIEQRLRLTSRVRRTFTPRYSYLLYRHLGLVRPVVLLGKDDWLYLRSRALPQNTFKNAPEVAACALAATERMLAVNGIDFTLASIPRKSVIHPEHLPVGIDHRPELDERLMRDLKRRGVNAPDLLEVFRDSEDQDLYHRTGTHWSQYAQALAAQAIAQRANILVPSKRRLGRIRQQGQSPPDRDLIAFLGISMDEVTMAFLNDHLLDGWNVYGSGRKPYVFGKLTEMPRIALAGTSFSAVRNLPRFLSHFAGEPVYNGAKKGGDSSAGIAEFVTRSERPESIILEIPNHSLFGGRALTQLGSAFSALNCENYTVLQGSKLQAIKPHYEVLAQRPTPRSFFTADPTHLVHSGDGVVAWHIRGKVTGAGASIRALSAHFPMELPWEPERTDLFIPLIGGRVLTASKALTILTNPHPQAPGEVRIEAVELVALFAEESVMDGSPGEPVSRGDRWWQEVTFPEDAVVPPHAGVVIEMNLTGESGALVDFELRSENEQTPTYELQRVRVLPGTRVVLNISAFAGERIASIRVGGVGSPTSRIERAHIHPLLANEH